MSRFTTFSLFFLAVFFQAGAYGLTFMLPRLFAGFGASEKTVGAMLLITAITTLITVYYSGHLSDAMGRLYALGLACLAIAASLALFGLTSAVGVLLVLASALLGFGWGLTYSLCPIVLTRLVRADERVRYFTLLSVFVMAGFGLSPVLASVLEANGLTISDAFFVTAALCTLSATLFFVLRTPVQHHALIPGPEASSRITLSVLARIFASPARTPVIMVFLGASVFAGLNNFQTVYADARGLNYANFFLTYTITVVVFRLILAKFKGGSTPYLTIALLQYVMCASILLFMFSGTSVFLYLVTAMLFGLGYGVSYPILVAMAANDAHDDLGPQTLQLFALTYFVGIFGFPLIAGWMLTEWGAMSVLVLIAVLAAVEASMALRRVLWAS
ncbi:MAG: MFS transporter [Sulfitobacter sp.]